MRGRKLGVPPVSTPVPRRAAQFAASLGLAGLLMAQQPLPLDGVAQLVARQERAVAFVRGKSFSVHTAEERDEPVRVAEAMVSFVRDTDPVGRSLLDYHVRTGQTQQGGFRRVEEQFGYDGTISWYVELTTMVEGVDDAPAPSRSGGIQYERNPTHASEGATGWFATMPGFFAIRGARFSQVMARSSTPFSVEARGPDVVLRRGSREGRQSEEWELRSDRAYCLARYRRTVDGVLDRELEIAAATPIHPHLWYPTKIVYWNARGGGWSNLRQTIEIENVDAPASVPDETFQPRFPHGSRVTDHATGDTVTIAGTDGEIEAMIARQAHAMRGLVSSAEGGGTRWLRIAGLIGMCAGGVLLGWRWRRSARTPAAARRARRTGRIGAGAVLGVFATATFASAQTPRMFEHMAGVHADNCGVNAVALGAAFHGRPLAVAEIASRLGCEPNRNSPVSLDRIAAVLSGLTLEVRPFRDASLSVLRAACLQQRAIAIVHTATAAGGGHYYVVAPAAQGLVLANPMGRTTVHSLDDPTCRRLAEVFTGCGLLLAAATAPRPWCLDREPARELQLGTLAVGEHVVDVPLATTPGGDWSLVRFETSCGCVRDVRLERGLLQVVLDAARLTGSPTPQHVVLHVMRMGKSHRRDLRVVASAASTPAPVPPSVVPSLVRSDAAGPSHHAFVEVTVPDGGSVVGWRSPDGATATPSTVRAIGRAVAVRHRVDWQHAHAGLEFTVRDANGVDHRIRCHLRAADGTPHATR